MPVAEKSEVLGSWFSVLGSRLSSRLDGRTVLAAVGALAVGLGAGYSSGCGSSSKPEEKCVECANQGEETWACYSSLNLFKGHVCVPPGGIEGPAIAACVAKFVGIGLTARQVPCEGLADTAGDTGASDTTCTGWNPGAHVTLVGGVRQVKKPFIDTLVASPEMLTECDTARVERQTAASGGGYKVVGAASTTFLYKLGLRNNDTILKVNNQTLNDFTEAATRFGNLYMAGTTSYTLQIKRSGVTQNLSYTVVP
jgi:hypothetical protein